MAKNKNKTNGNGKPTKSFMTVGPTLHYSHKNVQRCWILAILVYALTCLFWSRILSGSYFALSIGHLPFDGFTLPGTWWLGEAVTSRVSIFEYPAQIFVLAMLMAVLAVAPILTAQLLSFSYSIPFILMAAMLANLPPLAISLLVSCVAVACRPLRFRSRFISVALCMAPQLAYWGYFGGARVVDPLRFGFSYAPWIVAWLIALAIAGIVIGIGHFTRYKPGLIWSTAVAVLILAAVNFETRIGLDELDYQFHIAQNTPEQVLQFSEQSITEALDQTIENPAVTKYLADFFYPTEPIPLRAVLKKEIQQRLANGHWPSWFVVSDNFDLQAKKQSLLDHYNCFIKSRPNSGRMPQALYYKAMLTEYSPDIRIIGQREVLSFYSDYPHERSREIWHDLYSRFGDSPESIEARYRIASHWARQGRFQPTRNLLTEALAMAEQHRRSLEQPPANPDSIFSSFRPPADSAITASKLDELRTRINELLALVSNQNFIPDDQNSADRLAAFVGLNPHAVDFSWHLQQLLENISPEDPLRDNILLAQVKLIADDQLRLEKLRQLHKEFAEKDGGVRALYELARLNINLYQNQQTGEKKNTYLTTARQMLSTFVNTYPQSPFTDQAKKTLNDLPLN